MSCAARTNSPASDRQVSVAGWRARCSVPLRGGRACPADPEEAGMTRRAIALRPYGAKTLALGLVLLAGVTLAQDGRFSFEGTEIRPDKAKPGETVTIRTKVMAKDAASGVNVDL